MNISEWNVHLFRLINDAGKEYTYLNPIMIFIAEYMVIFLALSMATIWFTKNRKNKMMVFCGLLAFIFSEMLGSVAAKIHWNTQPFDELEKVNKLISKAVDNSFPSDHTILFFSICMTFWLFYRGWSFLFLVLATSVGVSRIWVGVHYPADVFVGALISMISATLVYLIIPRIRFIRNIIPILEKIEQALMSFLSKLKSKVTRK
ncbi:undecaprenyl-diphosphatase [Terribacillus aidingensis]|uniref:undecaprenyl-diphosphatase n=1 Tax=Terribacillus aidingensis TaxID=586416 RepID=UPI0034509540